MNDKEQARTLGVTVNAIRLWRRGLRKPHPSVERLQELLELTRLMAPAVYKAYIEGLK
jgi:transcriptional regulator with XRE-family HTH domain